MSERALTWLIYGVIPLLWAASLFINYRTFKQLLAALQVVSSHLRAIGAMLMIDAMKEVDFTRCVRCGATLQGSATQHQPGCEIGQMIANFPKVN